VQEPLLMEKILSAMSDGKEAQNRELYIAVEEVWPPSPRMSRETKWGRRPAYEHSIRSTLSRLVKLGLAIRVARGVYRITAQGLERIGY